MKFFSKVRKKLYIIKGSGKGGRRALEILGKTGLRE